MLAAAVREWEQELESAFEVEAEHDSRYRAARQQYLRQLLADPQQPRHVHGWIRNELRRLDQIERAVRTGRRPPGGSRRHLRGVPGMDVGHMLGRHNQHFPWFFRLEHASTNRARPGISRGLGLFAKYREAELLEAALDQAATRIEREAPEPFFTKVRATGMGSQEGHEILTRMAMSGLPLTAAEKDAIEWGVIRPDRVTRAYWTPLTAPRHIAAAFPAAAQPSHSLRPTPASTTAAAMPLIHSRFITLHGNALAAPTRTQALEWLGEALHLLQDSYSGAHTVRAGGTGRIQKIRAFFVQAGWPPVSRAPDEHNIPSDDRDNIFDGSTLRPQARAAILASRVYLQMALRHLASPGAPANGADLMTFVRSYLST